jgi:hypothetical protein
MPDYGQPRGRAYGDIFTFDTPAIDKMGMMLYQDQKQREALRQKQAAELDAEFRRNVSGMRDADINDFKQKYEDYKTAKKDMMRSKKTTPEQELAVLRLKSEMLTFPERSKARRKHEEMIGQEMFKNPDKYDDNAPNYLAESLKTPLGQLNAHPKYGDLTNDGLYQYKGTDTDFQKILKDAEGQQRQVYQKEEALDGGLQFKITPFLYGNTPEQYKESVLGALAEKKAGRDAAAIISQVDPATMQAINEKYKSIPAEVWEQMGVKKPQELALRNADSKAEQFATYQAQLYALNNLPKQGTPVFRDNKEAIMNKQQEHDKKMQAIRAADARSLVRLRDSLEESDVAGNNLWIDTYVDALKDEAEKTGEVRQYKFKDGRKVYGHKVALDPVVSKTFGFDKNYGELIVTKDGDFVPVYYETDKDGNPAKKGSAYAVDDTRTYFIKKDQFKLSLGKTGAGVKQTNAEMNNQETPSGKKTKKTTTVTVKGDFDDL